MAPVTKSKRAASSATVPKVATDSKRAGPGAAPANDIESARNTEMPPLQREVEHTHAPQNESLPTPTMQEQLAQMQTLLLDLGREVKNLKGRAG